MTVPKCNHPERFRGAPSLPQGCNGCLACYAEQESANVDYLSDIVCSMDELIVRMALILSRHLPSTDRDVADTLSEWNDIKRKISQETLDMELSRKEEAKSCPS